MNTGLDCDRLGGVGQGSGTVNIARTHAGMYARTGTAAPHVICLTLATVLVDDAAIAGLGHSDAAQCRLRQTQGRRGNRNSGLVVAD